MSVIQKDVPFDNHVPREKPFDNYVPHDKPFDLPVPRPQAAASPTPLTPDDAPQDQGGEEILQRP